MNQETGAREKIAEQKRVRERDLKQIQKARDEGKYPYLRGRIGPEPDENGYYLPEKKKKTIKS